MWERTSSLIQGELGLSFLFPAVEIFFWSTTNYPALIFQYEDQKTLSGKKSPFFKKIIMVFYVIKYLIDFCVCFMDIRLKMYTL